MKSKQSPLARINRVMTFYKNRGINSERVNKVYRNILSTKTIVDTPKGKCWFDVKSWQNEKKFMDEKMNGK